MEKELLKKIMLREHLKEVHIFLLLKQIQRQEKPQLENIKERED